MNIHDMTEEAYKNGYNTGMAKFVEKLKFYHQNGEGYCVVDDADLNEIIKEMEKR